MLANEQGGSHGARPGRPDATRYDREEGWHGIVTQPLGDVRIGGVEDRKEKIGKFKKAEKEQIVKDYRY